MDDCCNKVIIGNWGLNCHHIITIREINKKVIIIGTKSQFMGERCGIHVRQVS